MTSIFLLIETIYYKIFRRNYLKNTTLFLNFSGRFRNLYSILKLSKKKMTLRADVFLNLQTRKNLDR